MKHAIAAVLAVALVIAAVHSAESFGRLGAEFGRLGSRSKTKAVVIPGCSGTGLDFSQACNSQYIGIL